MMSLGEWAEAESNFREVLDKREKNPHALIQLGAALVAQDRLTEAEQPLNEAIRLDGASSEGWYQRGLLYIAFGQFDSALSDFETAALKDKHHLNALLRIAAIHHENKDWELAEAAWRNVLDVEPDNRVARRRIQDAFDGQTVVKKAAVLSSTSGITIADEIEVTEVEVVEESIVTEIEEVETIIENETPQQTTVKPRGTAMDWADAIDLYIKEH